MLALQTELIDQSRTFAIAVSGGSDSMALLRLAVAQMGADRVVALTVDHGLRTESADEATQVATWCAALNVQHHILPWHGLKPRTGIQAAARQARYDLMAAWCSAHSVSCMMTAHTANDQAETVVMRKKRTNSLRSLAGIWPRTHWNGIEILRPLVGQTREELRVYLRSIGQAWVDDPSNENLKYERIQVRKNLRTEDVLELASVATHAQMAVKDEDRAVLDWLQSHGDMTVTALLTVSRRSLVAVDEKFGCAILRWAIWACGGGGSVAPDGVIRIGQQINSGAMTRMTLAGAVVAMRGKTIVIGREPARITATPFVVPDSGMLSWDNRFDIAAPADTEIYAVGDNKSWKALLPKGLPAFAAGALPCLKLVNGTMVLPHFQASPDYSVKLCQGIRIS